MSSNRVLNCYRCEKIATVFVPENNRVLCDTHLDVLREATGMRNIASIQINESNFDAIVEFAPKQSTKVEDLNTTVVDMQRVPVNLITDHLAELATGVEPATCKVCRKPMQLHSQFSITKQKDLHSPRKTPNSVNQRSAGLSEKELQEATRPNFLANFADGGRGVCLTCNGSGLNIFDKPSDIRTIYKHINADNKNSGHYQQLMDLTSRIKDLNLDSAVKGNLPFYVTKYNNFDVNPHFVPGQLSEFPFSLSGYQQFDFGDRPHQLLHTLFHAIGQFNPIMDANHGHADVDTLQELYNLGNLSEDEAFKKISGPFCSTCYGHGEHPLKNHEDFEDLLEALTQKSTEIPRDRARRRKPGITFDPISDAGVVDLSKLKSDTRQEVTGHAGPNIKPHDHHNKPHTYKKRQQTPGNSAPSSGSSQVRQRKGPSSGGGRGKSQYNLVMKKPGLLSRFPVEKWLYETMNAAHDMTHTVYENPSYMYRNPNPMYYSVPRRQWGMSKPWRN